MWLNTVQSEPIGHRLGNRSGNRSGNRLRNDRNVVECGEMEYNRNRLGTGCSRMEPTGMEPIGLEPIGEPIGN